jgi:hypothetical protein
VTRYEQLREELGDLDPPIVLPERPGPLLEAVLFLLDRSEGERRVLLAEVAQLREQCADLPLLRQELAEIRIRAARLEQEALQEARQALVDRLAICLAERKAQERAKRLGKRLAREQAIKAQRRRLSAWRASLVGILRSRVMPPPIATLAARVEWLQGQGRQVGPQKGGRRAPGARGQNPHNRKAGRLLLCAPSVACLWGVRGGGGLGGTPGQAQKGKDCAGAKSKSTGPAGWRCRRYDHGIGGRVSRRGRLRCIPCGRWCHADSVGGHGSKAGACFGREARMACLWGGRLGPASRAWTAVPVPPSPTAQTSPWPLPHTPRRSLVVPLARRRLPRGLGRRHGSWARQCSSPASMKRICHESVLRWSIAANGRTHGETPAKIKRPRVHHRSCDRERDCPGTTT